MEISKPSDYKKLENYTYFESNDDECFYYITKLHVFFNKAGNILYNSNIQLKPNSNYLESAKKIIKNFNFENTKIDEFENIISIQKWFNTYGHFKDEIFNLCNFYELFNNKNYKVLMNYYKESNINYSFENYDKINRFLFDDNIFINGCLFNSNVIKVKKLILITHNMKSQMFHMFPQNVTNKILQKISDNNLIEYNKNIFITRGKALHLPRNLNNQEEIETYFKSINYNVINPEIIELELFINSIKNAENIFITWGGAIVNLCYVNPNANIYLLQSKSYQHENLFSIFKFLKDYKNLHIIKCDDDNNIDINKLL